MHGRYHGRLPFYQAEDNLHAVEAFFALYPELQKNDFFISGESYAGVYVPTLASYISIFITHFDILWISRPRMFCMVLIY